jgi:hypothetical protein
MVFVEGDDYRTLRRPGDDPAQFRSVVRPAQVPVPNSVVHQYRGENFTTSTWTDSVGDADMSITGVSAGTLNGDRAASSDRVDDFGVTSTPGPESLPGQTDSFGVAFVIKSNDTNDNTPVFRSDDGNSNFQVSDNDFHDGTNGELFFALTDSNQDILAVETSQVVYDGSIHLVCINKRSDQAADVSIFVDDMSTPAPSSIRLDNFDSSAYSNTTGLGFFARNNSGSISLHKSVDMAFAEFNEQPYSQQDRTDLKQRTPSI